MESALVSGEEFVAGRPRDLQECLTTENPMSIVFLTGHSDVPRAFGQMKAGSIDAT